MNNILDYKDSELIKLIDNRYKDSASLWGKIEEITKTNKAYYDNNPPYLSKLAKKRSKVRSNRIFVNTEAVINSLIANPPSINVIPARDTPESKIIATNIEKYQKQAYQDLDIKEKKRKGLRNLYFSRIVIFKVFWDIENDNYNIRVIDPLKIRIDKDATSERDAKYIIEDVEISVSDLIKMFPDKEKEIIEAVGVKDEKDAFINTKNVVYQEVWIDDVQISRFKDIILHKTKNPYWDWDGVPMSLEQELVFDSLSSTREKKEFLDIVRGQEIANPVFSYKFNYFDVPRKPYIFATVFSSEQCPVGSTDLISQVIPLQDDIDETKRNITENARIVNGIVKVDSSVMTQEEAEKLTWQTGGVIYGNGVDTGVKRETGAALPNFVLENLNDSRNQMDDIMAASSAFRGVREGQETRGGRLALIDQSFLRLNEFVQVVDYLDNEIFSWFMQLGKLFFTENHISKVIGINDARETIEISQMDFEDGIKIRVVAGKSLPEDRQFKYEQAQRDYELGIISRKDYLEISGYSNPNQLVKNKLVEELNPPLSAGISDEEISEIVPPKGNSEPVRITVDYDDLPIDSKAKVLEQAGIGSDHRILEEELIYKKKTQKERDDATVLNLLANSKSMLDNKVDESNKPVI